MCAVAIAASDDSDACDTRTAARLGWAASILHAASIAVLRTPASSIARSRSDAMAHAIAGEKSRARTSATESGETARACMCTGRDKKKTRWGGDGEQKRNQSVRKGLLLCAVGLCARMVLARVCARACVCVSE